MLRSQVAIVVLDCDGREVQILMVVNRIDEDIKETNHQIDQRTTLLLTSRVRLRC